MRVIESSYSPSDGVTPEESEKALEALASGVRLRASESGDRYGTVDTYLWRVQFTGPLGDTRWAVVSADPQGGEIADTDDEREADAAYEEQVRDLAGCQAAAGGPWWDRSDVSGVPLAAYTCRIEYLIDGEWSAERGDRAGTSEERLGQPTVLLEHAPFTLSGAASETARAAAEVQELVNRQGVVARATGMLDPAGTEADGVRVTVSGTEPGGAAEYIETVRIPAYEPTPEDIASYRRSWEQMAEYGPCDGDYAVA